MEANELIRKHNLEFNAATDAAEQRWRSKHSMVYDLELRLSDTT
jgi:hypothetical protein